jgi:ABC-type dipeptide/oligopeptide/nickel transport system permease component
MIAALNKMYCLLAEAKGLKKRTIALRHALRNAAIPILTLSSLQGISMLTGSILVETIFSLNGLASLFVQAARMRDYMLIQGCYTVFAIIAITFGILMDIIYYFVDPMVTY